MNIKFFLVNFVLICLLFAEPVDINTAQRIAQNIYAERSNTGAQDGFNVRSIEIINEDNSNLIYLFQLDPIGFIMIPGDDRVQPLLAYSLENDFILENMPVNLSWMMDSYKDMVNGVVSSNQSAIERVSAEWRKYYSGDDLNIRNREMKGPLFESHWNQSAGWNDYGPPADQSCEGDQAPSGCVAVSMSSIMHYWKYPTTGNGSNSCYCGGYGTQYADFGSAFYDYEAMGTAENSSDAAAFLVWHAGVAVNMNYDCPGSGAQVSGGNPSALYALENNFLYKDNIYTRYRSSSSDSQWINYLKTEIDSNRPMIYVGYNDEGGHAWNCDGYDDELFHMNWGWGGQSDGWFTVTENGDPDGWGDGSHILTNIEPESLNRPNLKLSSYSSYETSGDGDNVINPGESFEVVLNIENPEPWSDATNIEIIFTTDEEGLSVDENSSIIFIEETLNAGDSFSNSSMPFIVEVDPDIELGKKYFSLLVMGVGVEGADDNYFFKEYEIMVDISLNQFGFPIYTASQKNSPLAVDLDNDGIEEIIYGDYNGLIHVVKSDASNFNSEIFPFSTGNQIWGAVSSADLDGDGFADFVVSSKSKHLYIFDKNGLKTDYNADKYLLGTPAIGNIDDDEDLEIVVGAYSSPASSNPIYAINVDGTDVSGFPMDLGEKVKIGVALADFNNNGKDDIVVGTDDDHIYLIYDDGSIAPGFPFVTADKVQSAPAIIDTEFGKLIVSGCNDNKVYVIGDDGSLAFTIDASDKVFNSPAFLTSGDEIYTFISDDDGVLYAFDLDGNAMSGWPVDAGAVISKSVVFSDLNSDGNVEVIAVTEMADVLAFNLDGSPYNDIPNENEFTFTGAPLIHDIDGDGDLEILAGSSNSLIALDIKTVGNNSGYWSMYRGDNARTGYYTASSGSECGADLGDVSGDGTINILDLVQVVNLILEISSPTYECAADYTQDGMVNILDLVQIANSILEN